MDGCRCDLEKVKGRIVDRVGGQGADVWECGSAGDTERRYGKR